MNIQQLGSHDALYFFLMISNMAHSCIVEHSKFSANLFKKKTRITVCKTELPIWKIQTSKVLNIQCLEGWLFFFVCYVMSDLTLNCFLILTISFYMHFSCPFRWRCTKSQNESATFTAFPSCKRCSWESMNMNMLLFTMISCYFCYKVWVQCDVVGSRRGKTSERIWGWDGNLVFQR